MNDTEPLPRHDAQLAPGCTQADLDDQPPLERVWGFTIAELEKADQDEDR